MILPRRGYGRITWRRWESDCSLGRCFGYNQTEGSEKVIAPGVLVAFQVDIVRKNGNLLLNLCTKPDGTSPLFNWIATTSWADGRLPRSLSRW